MTFKIYRVLQNTSDIQYVKRTWWTDKIEKITEINFYDLLNLSECKSDIIKIIYDKYYHMVHQKLMNF